MTKDSGRAATAAADSAAVRATERPPTAASLGLPGAGVLAVLSLGWLVGMLWSAQVTISAGAGGLAITAAAYSLPGVISAVLVAGAALGMLAVTAMAAARASGGAMGRRLPAWPERAGLRSAVAFGVGLVVGVAGAFAVVMAYGTGTASMILAGTVAAAGTLGGAISALRSQPVVASAVAATLAVFGIGFLFNLFKDPLLSLYGLGETAASRVSAYNWFAVTVAICSGLAAGLVAYGVMRWTGRRGAGTRPGDPGGAGPRWPAYLAAGAGPGLLLLTAELITRVGGARVLALAGEVSDNDRTAVSWLDGSRINHTLVVLFVGAIMSTVAFGRTLPSPSNADDEPAPG
ncbi:MAG TPA: hypothetical protein VFR67_22600 [Pilimelia sp.]|nr:hypothetical protein [Pilimelia sp.]